MSSAGVAPTLYTVSDARFFLGLVALRNSLAITNPGVDLVVIDCGLTDAQRRRLEPWCRLARVDPAEVQPMVLKPYALELGPSGTIGIIDSDMMVVGPLGDIWASADGGRVVAFEDPDADRWFAEWQALLGLGGPPRRQPYVNTGFVAFSVDRHPQLLPMWRDACARLPARRPGGGGDWSDPLNDRDQDALNALLMSAFPRGALEVRPGREAPVMDALRDTRIDDASTLRSSLEGGPVTILHCAGPRKPFGATRVEWNAYARALPRVLLADDVPVRIERRELPAWLRGSPPAGALGRALGAANDAARALVGLLPDGLAGRAQAAAKRLAR